MVGETVKMHTDQFLRSLLDSLISIGTSQFGLRDRSGKEEIEEIIVIDIKVDSKLGYSIF